MKHIIGGIMIGLVLPLGMGFVNKDYKKGFWEGFITGLKVDLILYLLIGGIMLLG